LIQKQKKLGTRKNDNLGGAAAIKGQIFPHDREKGSDCPPRLGQRGTYFSFLTFLARTRKASIRRAHNSGSEERKKEFGARKYHHKSY